MGVPHGTGDRNLPVPRGTRRHQINSCNDGNSAFDIYGGSGIYGNKLLNVG